MQSYAGQSGVRLEQGRKGGNVATMDGGHQCVGLLVGACEVHGGQA